MCPSWQFQPCINSSWLIILTLLAHRGKNFEETCRRSDVIMDDVLPGVVIDGILGIDMNVTDEFMSQMDKTQLTFDSTAKETKKIVEVSLVIRVPTSTIMPYTCMYMYVYVAGTCRRQTLFLLLFDTFYRFHTVIILSQNKLNN